ncbi:hypothetical protein JYB55_01665 [Mycolicibacterium septicum]|nr:hypothetical protein [Mycolicibacterium septicum]
MDFIHRPGKVPIEDLRKGGSAGESPVERVCHTRRILNHFIDKTGLFTAVATEGFRRMAAAIGPVAEGELGFLPGGAEYVRFTLENRGFYEILFQPYLCHQSDLIGTHSPETVTDADPASRVSAGWSMSHGLATLQATDNLADRPAGDILHGRAAAGLAPEEPRLNNDPRSRDFGRSANPAVSGVAPAHPGSVLR